MSKNIKVLTNKFIRENKLGEVDYSSLKNAVTSLGYTVIEFNSIANDSDVETVIKNLNLEQAVLQAKGFTYANKNYRLVFINESLGDLEKLLVLAHETGHIVCEHFAVAPVIGKDVKDEYEANEFCHYLLKNRPLGKVRKFFSGHTKGIIAAIAVIIVAFSSFSIYRVVSNRSRYTDNYYITSSGGCYHKKECIFVKNKSNVERLSKEDFEKEEYTPCKTCLPDKD